MLQHPISGLLVIELGAEKYCLNFSLRVISSAVEKWGPKRQRSRWLQLLMGLYMLRSKHLFTRYQSCE